MALPNRKETYIVECAIYVFSFGLELGWFVRCYAREGTANESRGS